MSENKTEAKKDKKGGGAQTEALEAKREQNKRKWTVEACQKVARRYSNEMAWKMGAPSSYKSACARGWREECMKVLGKNLMKEVKKAKTA